MEYLFLTSYLYIQKHILEKIEQLPNGLYITIIRSIEANHVTSHKLVDSALICYGTTIWDT